MRASTPEFMDDPEFSGGELQESFRFIRLVNLLGGGQHALTCGLRRALRNWPHARPVRVLDVGCGLGDLGVSAVRWADRQGIDLRYEGLDCSADTLELARCHAARAGLGARLAFSQGDLLGDDVPKADLIVFSMVLHHFGDAACVRILRRAKEQAEQAVIVNDLERSLSAWIAAWIASRPLRHGSSRSDALRSIEKGFTVDEIRRLCNQAGLSARVRPALGFRILAVASTRGNFPFPGG